MCRHGETGISPIARYPTPCFASSAPKRPEADAARCRWPTMGRVPFSAARHSVDGFVLSSYLLS